MEISRNPNSPEAKLVKSYDTGLTCSQSLVSLRSDNRSNKYTQTGKSHWTHLSADNNFITVGRQHVEWKKKPTSIKHNILDCFGNMLTSDNSVNISEPQFN